MSCLLQCSFCIFVCEGPLTLKDVLAARVEPVTTGVANIFKVIWVIICASLEKLVRVLNQLSSEYREVSRQLAKDKEQKKMEREASAVVIIIIVIALICGILISRRDTEGLPVCSLNCDRPLHSG